MKKLIGYIISGFLLVLVALYFVDVQSQTFVQGGQSENMQWALSQTLNDYTEFENRGFSTITFYLVVPTGGEITFQANLDGAWENVSLRSIDNDVYQSVITSDGNFIGSIIGLPKIRFLTTVAGSAPGTVSGSVSRGVSILEGIEFGAPPHRFGYEPIHVDASFTSAQTATVLFTSDADKKGVVTDFYVVVSGTTDCRIKVFDETDTTGNYIFNAEVEVATNKNFIFGHTFVTPYIQSAKGNSWKITTSADCDVDLIGHGYQF
jgi:hypothetical protein